MTRESNQQTSTPDTAAIGTDDDMHDNNQHEETVFLDNKPMETQQADVSEVVGKFGRYHFILILVNILRAIPIGWTLTSVDFLAGDVDHSCSKPSHYNGSDWELEGRISGDPCLRSYVDPDGFVNASHPQEYCTEWEFSDGQPSSAVVEWNLVCERAWMKSAIQSVAFLGQLIGALVFGKLADKYGRLLMFDVAAVTMLIFGAAGSFAPFVEVFNALRFLQSMSTAGLQTLSAALYSEVALPADRNYLHLGMTLGLGITQLLLPAMAKWFDNWRYVQLATGLSAAALLPFLFYMEESPRWLLSVGKHKRGEQVLKRILRKNGSHDTDLVKKMPQLIQKASQGPPSASLKDLWPFQNVRRNLFVMFFLWAINNLALFGITYLPSKLGGDRFFNFTAASSAEIPAGFVGLYVIRKLRRRNSLTGILLICSTALLATALIPTQFVYARVACMFVARFCVVITTATMWVFTMELFPTSIRSFALSLCFFVGRTSAALAPFLRDLADYQQPAPFALLALLTALCAVVLRLSPETLGKPLPDSMVEADLIGREDRIPKNVV